MTNPLLWAIGCHLPSEAHDVRVLYCASARYSSGEELTGEVTVICVESTRVKQISVILLSKVNYSTHFLSNGLVKKNCENLASSLHSFSKRRWEWMSSLNKEWWERFAFYERVIWTCLRVIHFKFALFAMLFPFLCPKQKSESLFIVLLALFKRRHFLSAKLPMMAGEGEVERVHCRWCYQYGGIRQPILGYHHS